MARTANASLVNAIGYYIPVALFASVLLSVGSGLIATFSPHTSTGKWIGYQILYGVGRGLGLQMVCLMFPHQFQGLLSNIFSFAADHRCSEYSASPAITYRHGAHYFQPVVWSISISESLGNNLQ
jgi:hypothetical protein